MSDNHNLYVLLVSRFRYAVDLPYGTIAALISKAFATVPSAAIFVACVTAPALPSVSARSISKLVIVQSGLLFNVISNPCPVGVPFEAVTFSIALVGNALMPKNSVALGLLSGAAPPSIPNGSLSFGVVAC